MGLYQGDKPLILTGKSAFQQAVDAGYTGTQDEFSKLLAILPTESKQIKWDNKEESGAAAQVLVDAKAYSDGLAKNYDKSGAATQALTDAKSYTDTQIKAIPTPDVSVQISTHNKDTAAHQDIRTELGKKEASGTAAAAVAAHNKDTSAHTDIREALSKASKQFIINGTLGEVNGEQVVTVDKTRAEIKATVQNGTPVILHLVIESMDVDMSLNSYTLSESVDMYQFSASVGMVASLVKVNINYSSSGQGSYFAVIQLPSLSNDAPSAPGTASAGTSYDAARADHVHPKEVSDTDRANWNAKASKPKACLVTLKASGWDADAKTQVATVASVVADEAAQMIHPMPRIGQITTYNDAGIQLIGQGAGNVTFMCDTIPTENVDVWVVTEDVEDVTPPPPTASVAPKPSVNYTAGLSGLEAADVTAFAQAISNCTDVTNETTIVYVDHGDVHRKISVGDQVTLPLNGTNYAFDVIGFNHDALTTPTAYGAATATGKAGITFQMHDLFGTYFAMNDTRFNVGGWKGSKMRTSTMVTMKGYLPSDWQTAIKLVNKASGTGGGSSSGTETVSDSCFLLAEVEIFRLAAYSVAGEGTQYAYYKAGNSKVKHKNGSAYHWLERSPCSGDRAGVCFISDAGATSSGNVDAAIGVAFAFCV